ncbi:winged helix-turn-helix domain-containing protein [Methanobrevibacter curvatus]|uniref:ArnR1-like winged helix-turn-helix domain-containing protein n=1 Tax=Methanobrevibacter curvatus TaxID=49547 RepID=A0A166A4H8_9EURY|nr:winged helix-turn-helix domain-containing protein [Methanobrevibacter curvatus]KZX11552.1 hypothetical protein MBCUR_13690 [Methanobrevibacter curvatus]
MERNVNESFLKSISKHHYDILKSTKDEEKSFNQLLKEFRLPKRVLRKLLLELVSSGFIFREEKEDLKEYYYLTDLGLNGLKKHETRILKYRTPDTKHGRVKLTK